MPATLIDFVRSGRKTGVASWLLLALGVVALVTVAAWDKWYWRVLADIDANRLSMARQALEARKPAPPAIAGTQLAGEWARAMQVAAELNRPWDQLFAALEAEAGRPVALLSLEPDVVKGELVLTAEAKNFAEMLSYYRLLQHKDNLSAVTLHTHQINQQDKEKPVRFRITAKWMLAS